MNKEDIQDIFYSHLDELRKSNLPRHVKKAAEEISICRTNAMPGLLYKCPNYHFLFFARTSCNNRNCPVCQKSKRKSWIEKNVDMAMDTSHYQIVFKLPEFCNSVFLTHYKDFVKLLFDSANKTISKMLKYSQFEGSTPGVIMVVHTYGDNNQLHPHLHVILSGGGISKDNKKWISYDNTLFSIENFNTFYSAILKKNLTTLLKKHPDLGDEFLRDLVKMKSQQLYLSTKYENAESVIKYLGRTVKGSCIQDKDILSIEDNIVNYRDKTGSIHSLQEDEFIRRYLLHVLPPQLKSIRYYGLYSTASRKRLALAKSLIPENRNNTVSESTEEEIPQDEDNIFPHQYCPICGKSMLLHEKVLPFAIPREIINKFGNGPPIEDLYSRLAA